MVIYINTTVKRYTWVCAILFFCNYTGMLASVVMNKAKLSSSSRVETKECVQDTCFTLPIATQAYHPSSAQGYKAGIASWFVGLAEPLVGDDAAYSLAYAQGGSSTLSPLLTSTTVLVNNIPDQPHPLRGRPIAFLRLLGISPLVVPADNLSELILLNISTEPHRVVQIKLFDLQDQPAAAVDLAALQNPTHIPDVVVVSPNMTIAVAIRPMAGVFGDLGSGISMVMTALTKKRDEENQKKDDNFKPEDLTMGGLGIVQLDRMSPLIAVGHPVSSMKNYVTLHACELLDKFFAGVNVTSNINDGDAVVSVLMAYINRTPGLPVTATMEPVVSATVIGTDIIVASRATPAHVPTVAAHSLRTMRTSTGLDYLVVNGGVGADEQTARQVFALPLVRASGKLAHAYAPPVTLYNGLLPIDRSFVTLPETPEDLYTSSSIPAIVGGAALPAPVTDMVVSGDAVFVSTSTCAAGCAPGIWHSQAIFGPAGTIIAWTPWHRTGGAHSALPIKNFAHDDHAGTWWLLTETHQARMTVWDTASSLSSLVKNTIGTQGYAQHSNDSARGIFPGLLVIAGAQKVLMVQTDHVVDGVVSPCTDLSKGHTSSDGTLHDIIPNNEYTWLSMSGGDLAKIGTITSSAVVSDHKNMWVIVAGSGGIAVLAKPDGSGCTPGEYFVGATSDMAWRLLPVTTQGQPLKQVRKILYDRDCLYVLTTTGLFRVNCDQLSFTQHTISAVTLATINALGGMKNSTCADVFVAGPLACVATSIGCFRSGNGVDIATVTCDRDAQWTRIDLPYSPGPVVSLVPIGPVAHRYDNGYDANLYVLSAAATSIQARIYRVTISHTGTVSDTTVSLFPDEMVQGKRGYFLSIGDYRNRIATDGSLLLSARNRYGKQNAYVEAYSDWCSWPLGLVKSINIVRSGYRSIVPTEAAEVCTMTQSSGLGSFLVLTDIGLISNE